MFTVHQLDIKCILVKLSLKTYSFYLRCNIQKLIDLIERNYVLKEKSIFIYEITKNNY